MRRPCTIAGPIELLIPALLPGPGSCSRFHPIHISKSAIVALTSPLAPSAIRRVMGESAGGVPGARRATLVTSCERLVIRWLEVDRLEASRERSVRQGANELPQVNAGRLMAPLAATTPSCRDHWRTGRRPQRFRA